MSGSTIHSSSERFTLQGPLVVLPKLLTSARDEAAAALTGCYEVWLQSRNRRRMGIQNPNISHEHMSSDICFSMMTTFGQYNGL